MSESEKLPHTTIDLAKGYGGKIIERYYLNYQDKSVALGAAGYCIVQSLLSEGGLDLDDVASEREALLTNGGKNEIDRDKAILGISLFRLRNKINKNFVGLHILCRPTSGARTRLLTTGQIEKIRYRLANPEDGVQFMRDEYGTPHLFIDKQEVCSRNVKWIKRQELALFSMAYLGCPIRFKSEVFQQKWKELNPTDKPLAFATFATLVCQLRRTLEPAGWTISKATRGRGDHDFTHTLAPHMLGTETPSRPALETKQTGVAEFEIVSL